MTWLSSHKFHFHFYHRYLGECQTCLSNFLFIYRFGAVYAVGYMLSELMALEPKTQIAGVTCIIDAKDFGLKHLREFGIEDVKNTSRFIQVGIFPHPPKMTFFNQTDQTMLHVKKKTPT